MCSELFAALAWNLEVEPVFACDCDAAATTLSQHLWEHKHYYNNVYDQDFQLHAPTVDFFLAGFPCQPFSVQGLGQGVADEKNGGVIFALLAFIRRSKPKTFLLENVKGLLQSHPETLLEIMKFLKALMDSKTKKPLYTVYWTCLNAKDHGVPQNRQRIIVVGMRNDSKTECFKWPTAVPGF